MQWGSRKQERGENGPISVGSESQEPILVGEDLGTMIADEKDGSGFGLQVYRDAGAPWKSIDSEFRPTCVD